MNTLKERILTIIEKNSRINIAELAVMLGTEEIEIANALQELEEDGIICGYHTMINWDKTGIEKVTALIEVRVTPQRGRGFDDIAERIYKYPEVNTVYLMAKHSKKSRCLFPTSFRHWITSSGRQRISFSENTKTTVQS